MTLSFNSTAPQLHWLARAGQVAALRPQYQSEAGPTLFSRRPGAAPGGPAYDLRPGDVVIFRFPYFDTVPESDFEREKRPGLIIERDDATGSVVVAFATSRPRDFKRDLEIRVKKEFAACGLSRPTRFELDRRIRVSRSDARFAQMKGGPVIGRLPAGLMAHLDALHGRLKARYGNEQLRHVHEWIGANRPEDGGKIQETLAGLHTPLRAAA